MSAQSSNQIKYVTISIENTETVELDLFVAIAGQDEVFLKSMAPGESTVQVSPVGAVWSLRPRVSERQFTVRDGENTFRSSDAAKSGSSRSTRSGRGGASITSTGAPKPPSGG